MNYTDVYILWDHENCHVPSMFGSYKLIESRIEKCYTAIRVFGKDKIRVRRRSPDPRVQSNISNNVRVVAAHSDLSQVIKQAADLEIASLLKSWLLQRKNVIGVVVIISSDRDMCPTVVKVKNHGSAIVIFANNDCSRELRQAVGDIYSWQSVLDGENPVKKLTK